MADDDEYDPNADVPTWVNIVVPLALVGIFVLVLAWLTYTDKEIPVETLERWAHKLGLTKIKKAISGASEKKSEEETKTLNDPDDRRTVGRADSRGELTTSAKHVKTYGSVISDLSVSSCKSGYTNPYFYVYESNV